MIQGSTVNSNILKVYNLKSSDKYSSPFLISSMWMNLLLQLLIHLIQGYKKNQHLAKPKFIQFLIIIFYFRCFDFLRRAKFLGWIFGIIYLMLSKHSDILWWISKNFSFERNLIYPSYFLNIHSRLYSRKG